MKDFKKSKFFIVFVIFMALVYFYDTELYNELKAAMMPNDNININEKVDDKESEDEPTISLIEKDELLSPLRVYFFDVGQADSILVSYNDEHMLIDAGNNEDGNGLVHYLNSLNIDKFKYLVGTHAHEDHIGGMDDVINNFSVGKFMMPDVITTTKTFEDVLDSLENKSLSFDTPKIGDTFKLGNALIEVLYVGDDESDINNTSIVLRLSYENVSFIFTGDAESKVENVILDSGVDISSTVLKVGHHGSRYGTSLKFLKKVNPKYAIVSTGIGNSYGHPHDVVMNRLKNNNINIYRTDVDGTIIVSSNGNDISFKTIDTSIDGK